MQWQGAPHEHLPRLCPRRHRRCRVAESPRRQPVAVSWCLVCGTPCIGPRCTAHQRAYKARKYGPAHQATRAAWTPIVAQGGVACRRCGLPISAGSVWDLGHHTNGPEHARCNRSAGGRSTDHVA